MGQAERVADLMRQHHEQVAPAAAAQGPALVAVEVRFAAAGEEGVRQGAACRRRGGQAEPPPATPPNFPPPGANAIGVCMAAFLMSNFPPN